MAQRHPPPGVITLNDLNGLGSEPYMQCSGCPYQSLSCPPLQGHLLTWPRVQGVAAAGLALSLCSPSSRARKHSGFRTKSNTFRYLIVNYDPEPKTVPAVEPAPTGGSVNGASVPHHCVSMSPTQGQHLGAQHQGGFPCPRCFGSQGATTPSSLLTALTTLGRWVSSNEHIPELGEGSNRTS